MNWRMIWILMVLGLALGGCQAKKEETKGDEKAEKAPNPLEALSPGTWKGDFGEVEFREDGTVKLSILNCAHSLSEEGAVEITPSPNCNKEEQEGKLVLSDPNVVGIEKEDNTVFLFGAFLVGDTLHLGVGDVFALDAPKAGRIKVSPVRELVVGETCQFEDKVDESSQDVSCAFVEKKQHLFEYETPDRFEKGKMVKNTLFYLPEANLLISPNLQAMTFTKQ